MSEKLTASPPPTDFVTIQSVRFLSENGRNAALIRLHNAGNFTVSGAAFRLRGSIGYGGKKEYLPREEVAGLSLGPGEEVTLPPIGLPSKWNCVEAELEFVRAGDTVCRLLEDGTIERTYGTLPPVGRNVLPQKAPMRDRVAFCRKAALVTALVSVVLVFGLGLLGMFLSEAGRARPTELLKPSETAAELVSVNLQGDIERIC